MSIRDVVNHLQKNAEKIETSLNTIQIALQNGRKYVFEKSKDGNIKVSFRKLTLLEHIKEWWNNSQQKLAELFITQALKSAQSETVKPETRSHIIELLKPVSSKGKPEEVFSKIIKTANLKKSQVEDIKKILGQDVTKTNILAPSNNTEKGFQHFLQLYNNHESYTLFDAKPFLKYTLQISLAGQATPQQLRDWVQINNNIKNYFSLTHQKGGFEEIEVSTRQSLLLDICNNPAKLLLFIQSLDSPGIMGSAFKIVCEAVIKDVKNKAAQQPSIHGHPRDLYGSKDVKILKTLTEVFLPTDNEFNRKLNLTAAQALNTINSKLNEAEHELNDKYSTLFGALGRINLAEIIHKPVHELKSDEIELILNAKIALMDIDLGPGRSMELSLLMEHPSISENNRQGLKNLIALDNMRGEKIDLALFTLYQREHNEISDHLRLAIEGGGPTGLLMAITQFRAGANVSLFEKRSTRFDRTQIVRLDPKWMRMLKFYLGEDYHKLFSDDRKKGIIRDDGFGEIATLYLEDVLHKKLTKLISLIPHETGSLPPIERIAAHEITDIIAPTEDGGKFQVVASYAPQYDIAISKKRQSSLPSEVDMIICAGGKKSPIKDKYLPSSVAVNNESNYAVCSWLADKIPGQNPDKMDLFQDFRNMVQINANFKQAFSDKILEVISQNEENQQYVYDETIRNAVLDVYNSDKFHDFLYKDLAQPNVQTRTFENLGLIYIGMEMPQEAAEIFKMLEESLDKVQANAEEKAFILQQFRMHWFQTVMESYGLDKSHALTFDKIDNKFTAMFPVDQYRLEAEHQFSEIQAKGSRLEIVAAGDAFASPHFMRYSGLTGARENILHLQNYVHDVVRNPSAESRANLHKELKEKGERTAKFVIDRGLAFLQPKSQAEIAKSRKDKMISILDREATASSAKSYKIFRIPDDSFNLIANNIDTKIFPQEGWLRMGSKNYESFEQIKLELGLV